jgi:methylmalonyl-CoA mutase cobalamin-binding subunit
MPAVITEKAMDKLNLSQRPRSTWCKAVIGSLDFHAVGKNIIIRFPRAEGGIEVLDLGIDVSPQTFLKVAFAEHADVIFASALMFNAALLAGQIKKSLQKEDLRSILSGLVFEVKVGPLKHENFSTFHSSFFSCLIFTFGSLVEVSIIATSAVDSCSVGLVIFICSSLR